MESKVDIVYREIESDSDIILYGAKSNRAFDACSDKYRKQKEFLNDTFIPRGDLDARINIVDLGVGRFVGFYAIEGEINELLADFVDVCYQSIVLGKKRGITEEMRHAVNIFEECHGIEHKLAIEEYSKFFSNQRPDIAKSQAKFYYNVMAATLQLAIGVDIDRSNLELMIGFKMHPLNEIKDLTLRFFLERLG
jgi:hypothetical protein